MTENFPIEKFESHPTPFYYYDLGLLQQALECVKREARDYHVHYALKANCDKRVVSVIAAHGLGADCVSGAEVKLALECGIPASKVAFAGVGKTDEEIEFSLEAGIGCFNVESREELEVISEIAQRLGKTANIALRVNPNVDAHTHANITTGLAENKFGINLESLPDVMSLAKDLPGINLIGLHFHIGSQLLDMSPYVELCQVVNGLIKEYPQLRSINMGGGLGVDYENPDQHPIADFKAYFDAFRENLHTLPGQEVHFELGRSVVAQCGTLISRVIYVKRGTYKNFLICDAGMSELIRPALYDAHHHIENLTASKDAPCETYDVVGPICESSDVFVQDLTLPQSHRGDLIAIRSAGAYGETMSSHYNLRSLRPTLYSD